MWLWSIKKTCLLFGIYIKFVSLVTKGNIKFHATPSKGAWEYNKVHLNKN